MSKLCYEPRSESKLIQQSEIYPVFSSYQDKELKERFQQLKANVCDLNPALVAKCITGTEQDFILLMNRAKDFIRERFRQTSMEEEKRLLQMFKECVFGYYVLTPLIEEKEISDIKVLDYNHIVVKAKGKRYIADCSFYSPSDYNDWFMRILRIQRMGKSDDAELSHSTDRKGVKDYFLRIDTQLGCITSTERNNIHIRKIPKQKLSWDYLKENGMLDDEMEIYLKDRIASGYGFLISGRGGSGKSTLLNNMIDCIPYDQSVLVSQESDELYSEHPQIQFEHTLSVKRKDCSIEYSLEDELRLGLLQDIDNFVIGEIKGGEALYVFTTAMSTGARFFGTIHANTAAGSVVRLAQCARYISDYSMETLEEMLTVVPFVLIHMSRFAIDEILEIAGWDERHQKLKLNEVYVKGELECT